MPLPTKPLEELAMDHINSTGSPTAGKVTPTSEVALPSVIVLSGRDNFGKPRQEFADKIAALDDAAIFKEAEHRIWLSAYANNNPRSDYHWQADACYDEAQRRGKPDLYSKAWEQASRGAS